MLKTQSFTYGTTTLASPNPTSNLRYPKDNLQKPWAFGGEWYARLDSNQRPSESESVRPSSRKALRRKGSVEIAQISAILKKSHRILVGQGSGGFRDSSQIVVWIKCGFSSPVQLNIFTLYPWIRSAASHPSTLARSSTIPACAFASSYCFCS